MEGGTFIPAAAGTRMRAYGAPDWLDWEPVVAWHNKGLGDWLGPAGIWGGPYRGGGFVLVIPGFDGCMGATRQLPERDRKGELHERGLQIRPYPDIEAAEAAVAAAWSAAEAVWEAEES